MNKFFLRHPLKIAQKLLSLQFLGRATVGTLLYVWLHQSVSYLVRFLGARSPLGIAPVKNNNNKRTKKFHIALTCSLLLELAP